MSKLPNFIFEFSWNGTVCIATRTNSFGEYIGIELYDYASKALLVYIPFKHDLLPNLKSEISKIETKRSKNQNEPT